VRQNLVLGAIRVVDEDKRDPIIALYIANRDVLPVAAEIEETDRVLV
jgi:hypothetical protein